MFVIIDGSSMLQTCFYSTLPFYYYRAKSSKERRRALDRLMRSPDGECVNGAYAMTRSLIALYEKYMPEQMAVAWDSRSNFRKTMYKNYKSGRAAMLPELGGQFPVMKRILKMAGIPQFEAEGFEADDVIATLCRQVDSPARIYSKDADLLQLVSDRVRVWLVTKKAEGMYKEIGINPKSLNLLPNVFEFTPPLVEKFYGVKPERLPDKVALMGDRSDSIPGVYGIGDKAAAQIIKTFGSIEAMYARLEALPEEKDRLALFIQHDLRCSWLDTLFQEPSSEDDIVGKRAVILSKMLAKLCNDIEELEHVDGETVRFSLDVDGLRAACEEYGFEGLLAKKELVKKEFQKALFV